MSSITPLALDGFHNVICYCTLEVYDYINSVNNHFSKKVASGDSSELRETVLNSLRHYEVTSDCKPTKHFGIVSYACEYM